MSEAEDRAGSAPRRTEEQGTAGDQVHRPEADPSALLRELEEDKTEWLFGFERARVFSQAADIYHTGGDVDAARRTGTLAAIFDFDLVPRSARRGEGKGRFQPQWEFGGQAYPHVDAFDSEALDAIAAELATSTNPLHRSRYADFLWERRPHHTFARQAIDAYLEAADLYVAAGRHKQLCDALDRAAELSMQLGDQALTARSKAAAFRQAGGLLAAEQHPGVRWAIDILETLLSFGRRLMDDDRSEITKLADHGATFYAADGNLHLARSFLTVLAKAYEALRRPEDAQEGRRRIAASLVDEADQAGSYLAAVYLLRQAVQAYADAGDSAGVEALKRRLSDAIVASDSEFVTFSTEVTIPTAPLRAWGDRLLIGTAEEALNRLMTSLVPSIERVRSSADRLQRKFPLRHLFSNVWFEDKRIVGSAQTEDEHGAMSFIESYLLDLQFSDLQLGLAFERLEIEKGLDTETLMQFLGQGDLFDSETLDTVVAGVERYFAQDYVSALHVLVPQLEDVLRKFLGKLGLATTSFREGLTREKTLDIVLEAAELRSMLGEDLATYFEVLLIRPAALNLRNRTGHGLVKRRDCTRTNVQRILHCYLVLTNFVAQESAEAETPPS